MSITTMTRRWAPLVVVTTALAAFGAVSLTDSVAAQSKPLAVATAAPVVEAAADDSNLELSSEAQFAAEYGVSLKEATRRLELMGPLVALGDKVRALVPDDRLGGVFIDPVAARLVVRLTDGKVPAGLTELAMPGQLEVRVDAVMSHSARVAIADKHTAEWMNAVAGIDGIYAPEKSDDIVLLVANPEAAEAVARYGADGAADELSKSGPLNAEGLGLTVDPTTPGSDSNKGGRDLRTCTSAFAVKVGGVAGFLLTAAHCDLPQPWYYFNGGGPYNTIFVGQIYGSYADMQWLQTTSGADVKPFYFGGSTTDPGTPQVANATNTEGDWACHRGKATGYSCGGIDSVSYKPTYTDACHGVPCESRFVHSGGGSMNQALGDSGGPWFRGWGSFSPLGVHKGGNDDDDVWWSKLGNLPNHVTIWVAP